MKNNKMEEVVIDHAARTRLGWAHAVLSGIAFLGLTAATLEAQPISIPNASFESQVVQPPFPVDTRVDSWEKAPEPPWYDPAGTNSIGWEQLAGVFPNTPPGSADHIINMDGNQAAYLIALPEVTLFQDYESTDWQNQPPTHEFDVRFDVGLAYSLTVGVIAGGPIAEGSSLELSLYYRDGLGERTTVAATPIVYTPEAFPGATNFVDFSVEVDTVQEADAWAGEHLGVQIKSTFGTGAGYWDVDNVRLLATAVPEPTASLLFFIGGGALIGGRYLRKRCR